MRLDFLNLFAQIHIYIFRYRFERNQTLVLLLNDDLMHQLSANAKENAHCVKEEDFERDLVVPVESECQESDKHKESLRTNNRNKARLTDKFLMNAKGFVHV